MNPLLVNIIAELRGHTGRDNLISSRDLARVLELPHSHGERTVRDLLTQALHDGTLEELEVPLCAIPGQGYFLASDITEAQAYADWCYALASEALRKSSAVRALFRSMGLHLQSSEK